MGGVSDVTDCDVGGKLVAAHRALDGTGPLGFYGLADLICREYGCTPTEAVHEIRCNPHIRVQLEWRYYYRAYIAVHRWWDDEKRTEAGRPKGYYAEQVEKNRKAALLGEMAEREAQLRAEGRC